jgi:hypothetical protein
MTSTSKLINTFMRLVSIKYKRSGLVLRRTINSKTSIDGRLVPPSLFIGTEINFAPGRKDDFSTRFRIHVHMRQGQWQRCWSTHHTAVRRVLRAMARTDKLVGGGRPRDDATQMRAYSVETVALERRVFLDNQVSVEL